MVASGGLAAAIVVCSLLTWALLVSIGIGLLRLSGYW
jgi:hypothetical protein